MCTLGALAKLRGVDVSDLEPTDEPYDNEVPTVDSRIVGNRLDIAPSMAAEIMYENDESWSPETAEQRWERMRRWVDRHLRQE